MNRWEWLIENAKLDIYEFSVDTHETYTVENRYFPFYVMSYIEKGNASAVIEGKPYDTPAGHLILIPSYTRHSHFIPEGQGPTTFLWWHFNITVGGLDLMKLIRYPITLQIQNSHTFEKMFYNYMEFYTRAPSLPSVIYRRAKEYEIMAFLFENILQYSGDQTTLLDDIPEVFFNMMTDIIEHPERNVSLEDLARRYYLNSTYISNRFKKLFGITPIRLHNQVVIDRAKSMLRENENCSISELAQSLGFRDISNFTHFFTVREGCSPTDYRKKFFK